MVTAPGSTPTIFAVFSWSMVGACEPNVRWAERPFTCATQFIGSIAAWAR